MLVTVLGFVLQGHSDLQAKLVNSTLAELPIIGSQLRENVHALKGSASDWRSGCWARSTAAWEPRALRRMRSFNRAWAVPRNERPNPIALRLRSLLLLLVLGAGVLVTTTLSGLTTGAGAFGATVSAGLGIAAIPLTTLANVGLFMVAFRVLTASEVPARHLHIVAVVAGIGRQIVQVLGTYLVAHTLRGAPEAYGVVGLVLGLIAWIYLLALVIVFAAEVNVVAQRRLWPRALLTPFTDRVRLTSADERAYTAYAESERHKGFEIVDVGFEPPEEETNAHDGGTPGR